MIKLTNVNRPDVIGQKVEVVATFNLFKYYRPWLDDFIGSKPLVDDTSSCSVVLDVSQVDEKLVNVILPRYSLYFDGDTEPVHYDDIVVGGTYRCELYRMNEFCPRSNWEIQTYPYHREEYITYPKRNVDVIVEEVIRYEPEHNDVVVLCKYGSGLRTLVPYTTIFDTVIRYNRGNRLIYEFNEWKNR